ncbi:MAG: hypothetical protein ACRCXZ_00405 [Patescibacteria group bacterium]
MYTNCQEEDARYIARLIRNESLLTSDLYLTFAREMERNWVDPEYIPLRYEAAVHYLRFTRMQYQTGGKSYPLAVQLQTGTKNEILKLTHTGHEFFNLNTSLKRYADKLDLIENESKATRKS